MSYRPSYHDYVIKDGRLVGEFEEMYRRFDDPWHHELLNRYSGSRQLAKHQLGILKERNGIKRVLDLGCGKGQFAAEVAQLGLDVVGFDISETAVRKARERSSSARFEIGTLKDRDRILAVQPDVIVMCQITWFVLSELESFFNFLREKLPNAMVLHILAVYAPGEQKYGREYFTDLQGILNYFARFGLHYLEYGEIRDFSGAGDTFFLAGWDAETAAHWKQLPNLG